MSLRSDANVLYFVESARRTCALLESKPVDRNIWTRELVLALSKLYVAAQTLPGTNLPDIDAIPENTYDVSDEKWKEVFDSVGTIFGEKSFYWTEYDPTEMPNEGETHGCQSLADDLADIFRDIKPGLNAWDAGVDDFLPELIFNWKYPNFGSHWGVHLLSALRPLHVMTFGEDPHGLNDLRKKFGQYGCVVNL